jgi:hypothetical protein
MLAPNSGVLEFLTNNKLSMKNLPFLLLFLSGVCLTSCKDKNKKVNPEPLSTNEQLKITIQPMFGTSDLKLDQTVFTNEGYAIQFTDIRFYLTTIRNTSGKELTQAALFDYREHGNALVSSEGKPTDFTSLKGFFGVDTAYNHDDPTTFGTSNPLNILIANDMHWDWNPGYIFLKVEAKVDTLADGIDKFNHYVVFHVGRDEMLQTFNFTNLTWKPLGAGVYNLPLKLDLKKFLQNGTQTIDVKTEHSSHSMASEAALSLKVIQNLRDALSPL